MKFTPLFHKHVGLKATMLEYDGWIRPERYLTPEEEVSKVLKNVGICDISPFGKIDVKGMEIDLLLEKILPQKLIPKQPLEIKVFSSSSESKESSSLDELFGAKVQYVCRLTREHALIITSSGIVTSSPLGFSGNVQDFKGRAYLTNVTSVFAGLNLAGPASRQVLSRLAQVNLSPSIFSNLRCAEAGLAKIHAVIVRSDARHANENGIPSFDLYFGRDYAEYVWDALMDVGQEFDLTPFGVTAHNLIHGPSRGYADIGITRAERNR
jgi:sarcosine oxidase subunit alpha